MFIHDEANDDEYQLGKIVHLILPLILCHFFYFFKRLFFTSFLQIHNKQAAHFWSFNDAVEACNIMKFVIVFPLFFSLCAFQIRYKDPKNRRFDLKGVKLAKWKSKNAAEGEKRKISCAEISFFLTSI